MNTFRILIMISVLSSTSARAQLYIGPDFTLYVQPGSELFIDSMVLKPNVQLAMNDLVVTKSYVPEMTSSGNTLKRIYTITAPVNFSGDVGIYYDAAELNGLIPTSLSIAYEGSIGAGFIKGIGGTSVPSSNFVTLPLNTTTSLARVTAVGNLVPLSVSIIDYRAEAIVDRAKLSWITATEENSDYFEISRSEDGKNFTKIGKVVSKGNSRTQQDYVLFDERPMKGRNYYRLTQYDLNGQMTMHGTRVLYFNEKGAQLMITAWPNPTTSMLNIQLSENPCDGAYLTISDVRGRIVLTQPLKAATTAIDLKAFPGGIYFVRYTDNSFSEIFKVEKG